MRERPPLCPEEEDAEEVGERVRDPHGENLRWAKRDQSKNLNQMKVVSR
jgi:hypothetical protein